MLAVRLAAAAAALSAAVPALAAPAAQAADSAKSKYDPNRMVCVNRNVIGSRLQRMRVCHTMLEWEEVRLQEKVGLMRKQYNGAAGSQPIGRDSIK